VLGFSLGDVLGFSLGDVLGCSLKSPGLGGLHWEKLTIAHSPQLSPVSLKRSVSYVVVPFAVITLEILKETLSPSGDVIVITPFWGNSEPQSDRSKDEPADGDGELKGPVGAEDKLGPVGALDEDELGPSGALDEDELVSDVFLFDFLLDFLFDCFFDRFFDCFFFEDKFEVAVACFDCFFDCFVFKDESEIIVACFEFLIECFFDCVFFEESEVTAACLDFLFEFPYDCFFFEESEVTAACFDFWFDFWFDCFFFEESDEIAAAFFEVTCFFEESETTFCFRLLFSFDFSSICS
jgi:hypothetical protein